MTVCADARLKRAKTHNALECSDEENIVRETLDRSSFDVEWDPWRKIGVADDNIRRRQEFVGE